MNEFVLYEQLLAMDSLTARYSGAAQLRVQIQEIIGRMKSQLYRVAVIGEFKRGKSSLINAIIGAEVLPTDVLPMTAAVTRVTYGEKKIQVHYKDGRSEDRTLEELIDFATKYDEEKERTAASIREIEVSYPSVFCKNHIDILDTPGLNDNESMTEVTLSVLGDVDAAIMVISAKAPLSMTEQNLILDMIARPQIRHIIFVVTHIDAVSNRVSEQDKMIAFIRDRLSGELLDKARTSFESDPRLLDKARAVLEKPDIFGVSSLQAMEGFIQDNEELLEESRFPSFKKELLALLTAAQSGDLETGTVETAVKIRDNLKSWYLAEWRKLEMEKQEKADICEACLAFRAYSGKALRRLQKTLNDTLNGAGIGLLGLKQPELETRLRNCFSQRLTGTADNLAAIRRAVSEGMNEAYGLIAEAGAKLEDMVFNSSMTMLCAYLEILHPCTLPSEGLVQNVRRWQETPFPEFQWSSGLLPQGTVTEKNTMFQINMVLKLSLSAYGRAINQRANEWRTMMTEQNVRDIQDTASVIAQAEDVIGKRSKEQEQLQTTYLQNQNQLKAVLAVLDIRQ